MQEIYWEILKCLDRGEMDKAQQIIIKNNICEIDKKIFSVMINNWQYKSSGRKELERLVEEHKKPWGYLILSDFYLENNNHKANQRLITEYLRHYNGFDNCIVGKLIEVNQGKLFLAQGLTEKVFQLRTLSNLNSEVEKKKTDNEYEKQLISFVEGNIFYLLGKAKRICGHIQKALVFFSEAEKIFNSLGLNYYNSLCLLERSLCKSSEITDDELISLASAALRQLEKIGRSQEAGLATTRLNQLMQNKTEFLDDSYYQINDYHFISHQMRQIRRKLTKIASDDHAVMILGERGTGKEGIAKAIHLLSNRKDKPFIKVNLNSLSKDLFKSQLFGYEKGAFTGADRRTLGLLDQAQGGVFFMDEIGELPEEHQVTLLDVIYYKRFKRVGGVENIPIDIKFIAATNQNLDKLTEKEQQLRETNYQGVPLQDIKVFRADLLDRFVWDVKVPKLENRPEEILPLANFFVKRHDKNGANFTLSKTAEFCLLNKKYPGNVRSLETDIIKAIANASSNGTNLITKECFDIEEMELVNYSVFREGVPYSEHLDLFRHTLFSEGLSFYNSDLKKLTKSLHLCQRTLYYQLKELNLRKDTE